MRIAQAAGPRRDRGRHGRVGVLLAGSVLTTAMAVTTASSGATNLQMFEWTTVDLDNTATWSDGGTSYSGSFSGFASPSNVDYTTLSWLSGYTFTPTAASNATDISDGAPLTLDFPGTFPAGISGLVLFVNNLGAGEGFQIGGSLTQGDFTVLGKADTVTQAGTTFDATGTDEFSNGFAIQLNVPISQLNFALTQIGTTVTFGIGLQTAASGVPGAGLAGLATLGLAGVSRRRRR